ncbi:MAG: hypothetical protein L6Q71_02045 [Planctomycetes bacterium]|nr:hypothetical protein [Planctomycetota bacterium]NUQ34341.1 hypothetical protein [Planctomycetaceae bacterium]
MARHTFIADLEPGGVSGVYQIREAKLLKTVKGDSYLAMTLADKSGESNAKLWSAPPDVLARVKTGGFLDIVGRVELYRERKQIIVESFEPSDSDGLDMALYRVVAPVDPETIYGEIVALLESMKDPWFVKLARAYLDDEDFGRRFREWPAAKRMHHPYLHGLLEHVHSVLTLGNEIATHYPWVDRDLVLLGLFLHDSGKVIELVSEPAPGYSVEGELLGHITIGICKLDTMARAIEGFPPERLVQLKHIILSHHGIAEYGSPKPPMFAEALLVHTVEMLDAKMNAFYREKELPPENSDVTGAVRYSKLLRTQVYTPPGGNGRASASPSEGGDDASAF